VPNQCILVGLICPDGFHINEDGEGCIPNQFECKPGYVINKRNTACIPVPGTPIPFPFIIIFVCSAFVVGYSKMKESKRTKVLTSLIFIIGSFELLEYGLIAGFAYQLEQYLASILATAACALLLLANMTFFCLYRVNTLQDPAFSSWIRLYSKSRISVPLLCAFVNFKCIRLLFSGLFGLENTSAVFTTAKKSIH
jgi:hypothetical protein